MPRRFWPSRIRGMRLLRRPASRRAVCEPLEARHLLTVITVDTTDDIVDPLDGLISLREAILQSNASPDDDEIRLPAGTYTLITKGADEDAALTGDLDILASGKLVLIGSGSGSTTIDASGLFDETLGYGDRIFDIQTGADVSITGVTLTAAHLQSKLDSGGAAIRSTQATVILSNSVVTEGAGSSAVSNVYGQMIIAACMISRSGGVVNVGEMSIFDSILSDNAGGAVGNFDDYWNAPEVVPSLTIERCTISDNASAQGAQNGRSLGAALYTNSGNVSIVDSTITGNHSREGGAFFLSGGNSFTVPTVKVTRSTIAGNSATSWGGAFVCVGATLIIQDCQLLNNTAPDAGAILTYPSATSSIVITGSVLAGNSAVTGTGGAIVSLYPLTIVNSLIHDNSAGGSGGGIYARQLVTLINSTVSGNTAGEDGGGISGPVSIDNSTITGNRADADGNGTGQGGGVFAGNDSILRNTIVAGNYKGAASAQTPSDIELSANQLTAASSYNLIGDPTTAGGLASGANGNIVGEGFGNPRNIHAILDTNLTDNGGSTLTHALVLGSPAINAGDPVFDPIATNPPTLFDQRGAGFARVTDGRVDMGAFEFGSAFETVVAGRHLFYDESVFDGSTAGPNTNPGDQAAIAPDKQPLVPGGGLASAANVTSYSRGINGIMVDIAGAHPDITAADFLFHVGNNNAPESWTDAPAPSAVTVIPGGGDGGADRVVITWPSGSILNTWLEVQVLANAQTGLSQPDVFYYGNKVGDSLTNPSSGTFDTTTTDSMQVFATLGGSKPITDLRDYNRDGQVDTTDSALVFANLGSIVRLNLPVPATGLSSAAIETADLSPIVSALYSASRTLEHAVPRGTSGDRFIPVHGALRPHHGSDPLLPAAAIDEALDASLNFETSAVESIDEDSEALLELLANLAGKRD